MSHSYAIYIKHRGEYQRFSGDMLTSKGWTPETVIAHWENNMKKLWPGDGFALYRKERSKESEWGLVKVLREAKRG